MSPSSRWVITSDTLVNVRRIAVLAAFLFSLPAAPARSARAAEARSVGSLEVRPVAPPEALLRQQQRGRSPKAAAMSSAERAVLDARRQRQMLSKAFEAEMHAKAFKVGPGLSASRRPGWTPPRSVPKGARESFGRTGTTAGDPIPDPVDTVRVAFLRIDFLADRGGSLSSGTGRFNFDASDTLDNPVDRPPHNLAFYQSHARALEKYFDAQSYGRVRVEIDVWPAGQDSAYHLADMADLGPWRFGNSIFRAAVDMMRLSFFAADSQSIAKGDRVPWNKYDRFMIIHAGSDLQSDLRADSKEDIPSFTMFVDDTDRVIFPDSVNRARPIDRVAFIPETINQDQSYGAINGVIAHENGHNFFGFGDIYDINSALPVVGYWSLMDSGNLVGARVQSSTGEIFAVGLLPPSIDPFQRNFILDAGLLNYRQPGAADTAAFPLKGSQRHNDFVKVDLSSDEYVILENRFLSPAAAVRLLQDSVTRVVLGPREPDSLEYDALLPGGGVLAWHVDESVIPFTTSLRVNPDFGFNSNPRRLGLQVIEADALDDLGDVGSPFLLGSELDPYQASVAPELSDLTIPNLRPNQGTRPHARIEFLDDSSDTMLVRVTRTWQTPGWPVSVNLPPEGATLLTLDMNGDSKQDIVWAGGDTVVTDTSFARQAAVRDSAAIFGVRFDGLGLSGADTLDFAHLDRRPRPEIAAIKGLPGNRAAVVATTYRYSATDAAGGKVWAVFTDGTNLPGFPVTLLSPASTPPIIVGDAVNGWGILVGCEDGRVRRIDPAGQLAGTSAPALSGPIRGRLAWGGSFSVFTTGTIPIALPPGRVAAGSANGEVAVFNTTSMTPLLGWPRVVGGTGFTPDFLFMASGGVGNNSSPACADAPTFFVHHADRVWAFCPDNAEALPGWGTRLPDTLVAGLAAGDADGDGFPEVIALTQHSQLLFLNGSGRPSPGWPRAASADEFRSTMPPIAVDLTGDGRPEMVALTASGVLAALDGNGRAPDGWPLATGSGCAGSFVATDLEGDGNLEFVAPDRFGRLYSYATGLVSSGPSSPWPMLGGDPGRTCLLSPLATSTPVAPSAGPLLAGSLKAYPNPARRKPIQFAYSLTEDSSVEFRILDSSGHEVTRFTRPGRRSENLETWDPSSVPAGLYVARIRFSGPAGSRTESLPLGILH